MSLANDKNSSSVPVKYSNNVLIIVRKLGKRKDANKDFSIQTDTL